MTPSPAELEYFLEVSRTLNLSRAAERLGITQPSLSVAMKRLEETMGTALLIRHKNGVALTHAGVNFLKHVKKLMQYWDVIKIETLESLQTTRGRLKIGFPIGIFNQDFASLLANLLIQYERLELELMHGLSRHITEAIVSLTVDLGIVVNPFQHPDLVIIPLMKDSISFWVSKKKYYTQDPFHPNSVFIADPDLMQTEILMKKAKKSGYKTSRLFMTDSLDIVAAMAAQGAGIAILPSCVARQYALQPLPKAPVHHDDVCLVYRHENRDVVAIQTLAIQIKKLFKQ